MPSSSQTSIECPIVMNYTAYNMAIPRNFSFHEGEWTAGESSPSDNGATCIDVNVDTFICLCRDGYFGVSCSESRFFFQLYGRRVFIFITNF